MKLILQIAAGVLLAKLIWLFGEMIVAQAALEEFEKSLRTKLPSPPPVAQPVLPKPASIPGPSPPPPAPKLPTYSFPANTAPTGSFACMSGITLRKEPSGWTQLGGSTQSPTCTAP